MDWPEALEIVVGRTGHGRYRALCGDDHPDREAWRWRMIEKAADAPAVPSYPPAARQAANLAAALWSWAVSGFSMASDEEQSRRRSICAGCEHWDAAARRCRICGCLTDHKIRMRTEHCPLASPRW
jgi:hypothetical protein